MEIRLNVIYVNAVLMISVNGFVSKHRFILKFYLSRV